MTAAVMRCIVAVAAVLAAATARGETACARMAIPLKMSPSSGPVVGAPDSDRLYKVSLASLGIVLFGGTVQASFRIEPVDDTPAEHERLKGTCTQTKKGVLCDVVGPARLTIGSNRGVVATDFRAGEHAVVEMRMASLYCHDL